MEHKSTLFSELAGFLRQKREALLLLFFSFAVIILVLYLNDISVSVYGYGLALALTAVVLVYGRGFYCYHKKVQYLITQFHAICLGVSSFPEADGGVEDIYQSIAEELLRINGKQATDLNAFKKDMTDYYTMWMHQVKTPIAAMHLLLQSGEKVGKLQELSGELFKIEEYVGMVMTYLHTEESSSDYVIRECLLDELIRQSVRKYARIFIRKKIQIDLEEINAAVLTDEKWTVFVIGQVLSNALKYTNKGRIHIYLESGKTLVIEDTGIGIAKEDLPRIFEKGYTGYNGRMDKKSTGIGLYLCKRIFDRLGHNIWAESKMGEGTRIKINFSTWKDNENWCR